MVEITEKAGRVDRSGDPGSRKEDDPTKPKKEK